MKPLGDNWRSFFAVFFRACLWDSAAIHGDTSSGSSECGNSFSTAVPGAECTPSNVLTLRSLFVVAWTQQDFKIVQVGLFSGLDIPFTGSASTLVLSVRILLSVVVPPTLYVCSRSWLQVAHLVSPTEHSPSGFFPFFSVGFWSGMECCTCEKDIVNLSFPVRKAGGSNFKTMHLPLIFLLLVHFAPASHHTSGQNTNFRILAM